MRPHFKFSLNKSNGSLLQLTLHTNTHTHTDPLALHSCQAYVWIRRGCFISWQLYKTVHSLCCFVQFSALFIQLSSLIESGIYTKTKRGEKNIHILSPPPSFRPFQCGTTLKTALNRLLLKTNLIQRLLACCFSNVKASNTSKYYSPNSFYTAFYLICLFSFTSLIIDHLVLKVANFCATSRQFEQTYAHAHTE